MSQQVIPFTTQLNQQRLFQTLQNGLSWVGWFSALVAIPQMQRAFELLDHKHARFALNPFRVLLPQLVFIFVLAAITVVAGAQASVVSTFGHSGDDSAVIFTIVVGVFFMIAISVALVAAWVLGTHHTTYTIVWILFAVLSILAVFGGSIVSAQSADVDDFTIPRWDFVRMFVPAHYQTRAVQVYVRDAQTLLRATGLGGVMLFLYGFILTVTSMHSAFLIAALAPSVSAGPDAIHHATASLRGGLPDPETSSAVASGYYGTLGGGEEGGPGAKPKASAPEDEGLEDIQIVDSDEDEESGPSGRTSKRPGEGGYQASPAAAPRAGGMARGKSSTGVELSKPKASEAASLSPRRGGGGGYGTASSAADEYSMDADSPPKAYTMPSWGEYTQVSANLLRRELGSRRLCLVGVAVYVVVGLGLLIAGVSGLGVASRCGALARGGGHVSSYSVRVDATYDMVIGLTNTFPSGRVRVESYDADAAQSGTFNISLRTFSLDASHVYSAARLASSVSYFFDTDPFADAFSSNMSIGMSPLVGLDDSLAACDAAELVVYFPMAKISLGTAEQLRDGVSAPQLLRSAADRSAAAVAGVSVDAVRQTYVEAPRFDIFASSAATRAGLAQDQPPSDSPAAARHYAREIRRVEAVRSRAAAEPDAALEEHLRRIEDPTAMSIIPAHIAIRSRMASGYAPGGAADRLGMGAPLRIGPASDPRSGLYFSARDLWEQEAAAASEARAAELTADIRSRHGSHPCLRRPMTAADARSWLTLLDSRAEARATVNAKAPDTPERAAAAATLAAVSAEHDAAVVRLEPVTHANSASLSITTTGAYVDLQSSLLFQPPLLSSLSIKTDTAPIVAFGSLAVPVPGDPAVTSDDTPSIKIRSNTGDVNATTMVGPGVDIETEGDIFTEGVVSAKVVISTTVELNGMGTMRLKAKKDGMLTVTQGLGGYDADFSTDKGMLLVTNCAGAVGTTINFESSAGGDIWFTTMILAGGNVTRIRLVGGALHANVIYSNLVLIDASEGGSTNVLEAFLGIETLRTGVMPALKGNYSMPGMSSFNPKGSISITGIGGAPAAGPDAPAFASNLKVDMETTTDPITVQVNGGGFNGPYVVDTAHGQSTVEIIGVESPNTGILGAVSKTSPSFGHVILRSDYGDIDLAQLVNSIPDLSSLGIVI